MLLLNDFVTDNCSVSLSVCTDEGDDPPPPVAGPSPRRGRLNDVEALLPVTRTDYDATAGTSTIRDRTLHQFGLRDGRAGAGNSMGWSIDIKDAPWPGHP